ncbi:MAG TPA: TIGR02594 family protein, partial [Ohtaekwangia sp.]|uniref:TIGR02594 family protein n=1 Tax=Ohtaekwangia sp. TaxID=2066019 RepID=UPI002F95A624
PITVQTVDALPIPVATNNTLYNGLITSVQWRTDQAFSSTEGDYYGQYQYNYDDKYQLLEADYAAFNKTTKMFDAPGNNYRLTGMSYDPNGNIQSLKRYDGDGLYKNNLSYSYLANTNKLDKVNGYVNKFTYNAVGQMTGEDKESDTDQYVEYDVTGKVRKVFMDAAKLVPNAEYLYDDRGFRLAKINYQTKRTTWYIRDASGNILSIYEQAGTLPDPLQPINWTTLTNVVNTNGTLTLQSGATTGSAKASNTLAAGQDGYFEYILDDIQPVDIGFTVSGIGTCYFSVYAKPNANVVIRKAGALQASFTYSLGHKLKLEKVGDKLRFWQNGTLRFEISGVAGSTAQLFANLTATGAILDNLTFKTISTTTDQASLVQTEVPIYGAGKLGTFYPAQDSSAVYELTDHLGNVRALVRENINTYTATMEDNGQSDLTNPRVTEMNYFRNIFETEVQDVQMNHTQKLAGVPQPDKAAYLYWISGTQGMDMQDKSVGPAIALKVNTGDKINLETFARYEHKEDFTENVTLAAFSQLLGSTFAYVQGFEAMSANQATQTFQAALPALLGAGKDASQPSAFLNYIVFNKNMQSIASDRIQVSEAAAFEPDERAVKNMFEKLALNVIITEPGYIYAWVSNGSENTKVWFDDFRVSHVANFVTQATDYGVWGDIIREQKTDESEYRYSYQGEYAERDDETGWSHFELREYDPIIGRWSAIDPARQYWSPYLAMGNSPSNGGDADGSTWYQNNETCEFQWFEGWAAFKAWISPTWDKTPFDGTTTNFTGEWITTAPPISVQGAPEASEPAWIRIAKGELGQEESEFGNNPRILQYLQSTGLDKSLSSTQETPWCAAFVNWTMETAGEKSTNSARALDWADYGTKLKKPALYGLGVMKRKGGGHVGFIVGQTAQGDIVLLGGNQSDKVSYSAYKMSKFVEFVYPKGYTPNYNLPVVKVDKKNAKMN